MRKIRSAVLAALAFLGLAFGSLVGCGNIVAYAKYANADAYAAGSVNISAEGVDRVEIDWVAGSIEVEQTAAPMILLEEAESIEKDSMKMHYYLDGNVLRVKYCQAGYRGRIDTREKNLRVEIPAGLSLKVDSVSAGLTVGVLECNNLSIETTSGNLTAERISCAKADLETTSGDLSIGELRADELSVESTSGKVSVTRLFASSLEAETTSGALTLGIYKAVRGEMESVSGNIVLTLAEGLGAELLLDTVSGSFTSDKKYDKQKGGKYLVYGADGVSTECELGVETTSGKVQIL